MIEEEDEFEELGDEFAKGCTAALLVFCAVMSGILGLIWCFAC